MQNKRAQIREMEFQLQSEITYKRRHMEKSGEYESNEIEEQLKEMKNNAKIPKIDEEKEWELVEDELNDEFPGLTPNEAVCWS